ncbi:hypothetical protein O3P69_009741 [Scylla paramamosain]|uniref:Uncharacterized protein n=1 Tax=Scylla paramamosain TaxID=85552 RepID=A0AAW0SMT3_SCYPA
MAEKRLTFPSRPHVPSGPLGYTPYTQEQPTLFITYPTTNHTNQTHPKQHPHLATATAPSGYHQEVPRRASLSPRRTRSTATHPPDEAAAEGVKEEEEEEIEPGTCTFTHTSSPLLPHSIRLLLSCCCACLGVDWWLVQQYYNPESTVTGWSSRTGSPDSRHPPTLHRLWVSTCDITCMSPGGGP